MKKKTNPRRIPATQADVERARIPRHIIDSLSVLSKRLSKDYKEAVETRWPKPAATDEGGTT